MRIRSFDDDFRVETESVNGSHTVTYQYDPDSLVDLVEPATGPDLVLVRNAGAGFGAGLLTGTTQDSVATTETPSAFGELAILEATASGSPLYSLDVSARDALGRIETKTETIGAGPATASAYTYDAAGRLDTVTVNGILTADYAYDANGNRTHEREDLAGPPIAVYDDQDRLLSYDGTSYTYSAAGDLETSTDASGTTTYGYDALGNLRSVVLPDGEQIEYGIDGQNRRVGRKVCPTPCTGGATPQPVQGFLYGDQLRIVAELDGSNNVVSRFVYATRVNVPDFMIKSGVTYRILSDQVGSVRVVVDATTGMIAQRIDYDAFGNPTYVTGPPDFQPFGFAGGLTDADTGLVRFGARDYDPRVGRWTSKDPIRFDGGDANLYSYATFDPVNLTDPEGLWTFSLGITGSAGVGLGGSGGTFLNFGFSRAAGFSFSITGTASGSGVAGAAATVGFTAMVTAACDVSGLLGTSYEASVGGIGRTGAGNLYDATGRFLGGFASLSLGRHGLGLGSISRSTTSALLQFRRGRWSIGDTGAGALWSSN